MAVNSTFSAVLNPITLLPNSTSSNTTFPLAAVTSAPNQAMQTTALSGVSNQHAKYQSTTDSFLSWLGIKSADQQPFASNSAPEGNSISLAGSFADQAAVITKENGIDLFEVSFRGRNILSVSASAATVSANATTTNMTTADTTPATTADSATPNATSTVAPIPLSTAKPSCRNCNKKLTQLTSKYAALNSTKNYLEADKKNLQQRLTETQKVLTRRNRQLATVNATYIALKAQNDGLTQQLSKSLNTQKTLQEKNTNLTQQLSDKEKALMVTNETLTVLSAETAALKSDQQQLIKTLTAQTQQLQQEKKVLTVTTALFGTALTAGVVGAVAYCVHKKHRDSTRLSYPVQSRELQSLSLPREVRIVSRQSGANESSI